MEKLTETTRKLMHERFGRDAVLALATVGGGVPHVRNVNAYYEDGAFYIITDRRSNKMRQIEQNAAVALAGEWFTAHGTAVDMGSFCRPENAAVAQKLRAAFAAWLGNGHTDLSDANTCIVCVRLRDGLLLSHGTRYEIDFT